MDVPEDADAPGVAAFGDQRRVEGGAMLTPRSAPAANTTSAKCAEAWMPRGEPPAWTSTGRTCGDGTLVQRPPDLEEGPLMVDAFTFARVLETRPVSRSHTKASGSTLAPQRLADVDELLHPLIAQSCSMSSSKPKLAASAAPSGRHDVEGDASTGDVVQRVEQSRHVERVHERRRIGQAEADMLRF